MICLHGKGSPVTLNNIISDDIYRTYLEYKHNPTLKMLSAHSFVNSKLPYNPETVPDTVNDEIVKAGYF